MQHATSSAEVGCRNGVQRDCRLMHMQRKRPRGRCCRRRSIRCFACAGIALELSPMNPTPPVTKTAFSAAIFGNEKCRAGRDRDKGALRPEWRHVITKGKLPFLQGCTKWQACGETHIRIRIRVHAVLRLDDVSRSKMRTRLAQVPRPQNLPSPRPIRVSGVTIHPASTSSLLSRSASPQQQCLRSGFIRSVRSSFMHARGACTPET